MKRVARFVLFVPVYVMAFIGVVLCGIGEGIQYLAKWWSDIAFRITQ